MQDHVDWQIPDILQWRPKWWWDPIPPWLAQDLTREIATELTRIQLNKQAKMLEAQLDAVKQTEKLLR